MASEQQDQLYSVWGPVWEQEEANRAQAWSEVLLKHTIRESGKTYDLLGLAELGLQDVITQAQSDLACELRAQVPSLVQAGLPCPIRGLGWKHLLDVSVRRHRGHYNALVQQSLRELASKHTLTAQDIKEHVAQLEAAEPSDQASSSNSQGGTASAPWQSQAVVWLQQIEKDLPRTFSGHPVMEGAGRQALRRVLAAFAMHDPSVGYCQGMNFITAVLLMFMSEEDAFWCLVIIVEDVLTGYFTPDMTAAQVDQRVFQQLVSQQLPAVAVHLEAVGADLACVAPQWFLCAYVNSLPLETCLRVWDVMFFKKSPTILFQVGLALVDVYSEALLAARDVLEAFQVVQGMAALTHDASHLLAVAMVKFSSLDDQTLMTLRAQALVQVEKQRVEDEKADKDRQLQKHMSLLESARHLANHAGLIQQQQQQQQQQPQQQQAQQQQQQQQGPAPAPAPPQQSDSAPISVVKKLLARLEKRTEGRGEGASDKARPASDSPYERSGTPPAEAIGASGDSDSDLDPSRVAGRRSGPSGTAGNSGGRGPSGRAGNHTVPDSNDSPLLKVAGVGGAAVVGGLGLGVEALGSGMGGGEDEEEQEDAEGTYVPPTVPLFPEAKELISLSPSESAAVPDIDDLLRLSSLKRNATAAANRSSPQRAQGQNDLSTAAELSLGPSLSGPSLALDGLGEASGGPGEGPEERSSGPSLRLHSDVRFPHVGEDSPGTPAGLAKDTRLQQLDAMLWHETPPWKNLQQFSAAQRGEDVGSAGADAAESSVTPKGGTSSTGQQGAFGDPLRDGLMTGAQEASTGAVSQAGRGSATKPQVPQQPAPSRAMQLALTIAMRKTSSEHHPQLITNPPNSSSGPTSPQPRVSTGINATGPSSSTSPGGVRSPSRNAAIVPTGAAAAPDVASVWRQAGWGLEVLGSAQSGRSLGVSSVPTEDLDALHVGTGHQYTHSNSNAASNGGAIGIMAGSGALAVGAGAAELKDDWVDLHAVGEDLLHAHGASRPVPLSGGQPLFPASASVPVGGVPHQHPSHVPHHTAHHTAHASSGELRKTISNGWVDGALLSPPLSHPTMDQGSHHSSSGALILPSITSAPMPTTGPRLPGPTPCLGISGIGGGDVLHPVFSVGHMTAGGLPPAMGVLSPLAREGLAHSGALSSSGGGAASNMLEVGRLQAGLSVVAQATPEAVMEVCQREGIQPLMNKCHTLNSQYKRVEAGHAGADGGCSDEEEHPLQARSLSNRPLDTKSTASTHAPTSNYHRLLNTLLEHISQALSHANDAVQSGGASATGTFTSAHAATDGGAPAGVGGKSSQHAAAAALFSLQVAHQHLTEALEDTGQAEKVEHELLRGYKSLANASCQKLHDMAEALAERDAVVEALSQKLGRVTQVYAAKEEQLVDKVSDQEDAIRDMQQRLAMMAQQGQGQGPGGAPEGSRIMGAFHKLRERNSRPSSPPTRRNGSNATVPHPLLVQTQPPSLQEQALAQGLGGAAWGDAGSRGDDGGASREEGRVTKWLAGINRFMKKEEEAG